MQQLQQTLRSSRIARKSLHMKLACCQPPTQLPQKQVDKGLRPEEDKEMMHKGRCIITLSPRPNQVTRSRNGQGQSLVSGNVSNEQGHSLAQVYPSLEAGCSGQPIGAQPQHGSERSASQFFVTRESHVALTSVLLTCGTYAEANVS